MDNVLGDGEQREGSSRDGSELSSDARENPRSSQKLSVFSLYPNVSLFTVVWLMYGCARRFPGLR